MKKQKIIQFVSLLALDAISDSVSRQTSALALKAMNKQSQPASRSVVLVITVTVLHQTAVSAIQDMNA